MVIVVERDGSETQVNAPWEPMLYPRGELCVCDIYISQTGAKHFRKVVYARGEWRTFIDDYEYVDINDVNMPSGVRLNSYE